MEELEELLEELGIDIMEPLATAIVVARIAVSPLKLPEVRVLVEFRVR